MTWRFALSATLAFVCTTTRARADIDPPPGYRWVRSHEVVVTNLAANGDWVFVQFPCSSRLGYCVLSEGDPIGAWDGIYALPKRDVVIARSDGGEPRDRPILKPEISLELFERDPRVRRLARRPDSGIGRTLRNVPVQSARYVLSIDAVGEHGIDAHMVQARYECAGGSVVELPWGANADEPPVPSCPVSDDHGELDGGASSELPAFEARRWPFAARRGHVMWAGLAITSLGLLCAGLLLRGARAE